MSEPELEVGRRVEVSVPVRLADVGGWTDTWFGAPGRVCHVAVGPAIDVVAELVPSADATRLDDPLLAAAVSSVVQDAPIPEGLGLRLEIRSSVPPGASLGTSASVLVGLVAAVDALVAGGCRDAPAIARLAHHAETVLAGREAGVQDQWAAAMGGVGLLAIGPYPEVRHEAVVVDPAVLDEVGERLVTVVFGAHDSSLVHGQVINDLVTCSGSGHDRAREALRRLSALAGDAADALRDGEIDRWGDVLIDSTEAQRSLHAGLIGPAHQAAIDRARALGAAGWKVNGAGGDGGSLTVLASASGASASQVASALVELDPSWSIVPLRPVTDGVLVSWRGRRLPSPR